MYFLSKQIVCGFYYDSRLNNEVVQALHNLMGCFILYFSTLVNNIEKGLSTDVLTKNIPAI